MCPGAAAHQNGKDRVELSFTVCIALGFSGPQYTPGRNGGSKVWTGRVSRSRSGSENTENIISKSTEEFWAEQTLFPESLSWRDQIIQHQVLIKCRKSITYDCLCDEHDGLLGPLALALPQRCKPKTGSRWNTWYTTSSECVSHLQNSRGKT